VKSGIGTSLPPDKNIFALRQRRDFTDCIFLAFDFAFAFSDQQ
jgi:hypothetical protein